MMKSIENMSDYIVSEFNRLPSSSEEDEKNTLRVYRLINEALKEIQRPGSSDWVVDNGRYCSKVVGEPYGFEKVGSNFCVYAEERGKKSPIALFSSSHIAAKYFVWTVSSNSKQGEKKIDWSLYLDMLE